MKMKDTREPLAMVRIPCGCRIVAETALQTRLDPCDLHAERDQYYAREAIIMKYRDPLLVLAKSTLSPI